MCLFSGDRVMPILLRDYETRSQLLLKAVGSWKYSTHASTDVWCCAYAVDDGPIQLWIPGDPVPPAFIEAANNPDWLVAAFNDSFERLIERHIMVPRYGWPEIPIERHRCLQAAALALALPASLVRRGRCAASLSSAKIQPGDATCWRCRGLASRALAKIPLASTGSMTPSGALSSMPTPNRTLPPSARCISALASCRPKNKRIGFSTRRSTTAVFHIDRKLLDAAIKIAEAAKHEIDVELPSITEGAVSSINQTAKMLAWLSANGCAVADLQKPTLQKVLNRGRRCRRPPVALIELRLDGAHAAALKLHTMRNWMSDDDRIRGCFRYHGASTGRFTSLGVQAQNMKRAGVKDMAAAIEAVGTGDLNHLRSRYAQPMSVIGDIARALVCAPPGRRLIIADLSGIESRMTAWVSGQQSKLDQWANFDRSGNPEDEPYLITGHKIFGLPKDRAREPGKTGDLAFGYMGGVGAWMKLAPPGDTSTEIEIKRRQQIWRRAHPHTVRFWHALDRAAKSAMRHPDKIVPCRGLAFRYCARFVPAHAAAERTERSPIPSPS